MSFESKLRKWCIENDLNEFLIEKNTLANTLSTLSHSATEYNRLHLKYDRIAHENEEVSIQTVFPEHYSLFFYHFVKRSPCFILRIRWFT